VVIVVAISIVTTTHTRRTLAQTPDRSRQTPKADFSFFVAGSPLRVGIVHARWNTKIIDALLEGCKRSLKAAGVRDENIVVQSVPGSYELPFAVQR
jgi:6,7-dimethyl-8-ribityllumazine synthase